MSSSRILVVEDRDSLRRMLDRALSGEGHRVETAATGEAALELLAQRQFDLVLTDLKLPGQSGIDVLRGSRQLDPSLPVVVLTAYGTVHTAVEAMKEGAVDFLEKPVEIDDLFRLVANVVGDTAEEDSYTVAGAPTIVGRHPRVRTALRLLERVARTDSNVLLTGESGTGKELFARALHALSPRSEGAFVAVNCAAIPETLIENELFGHEKGSFTGAHRRQPGRFEVAKGGTLLMDEIGELPLAVQAKVLRVLEERTFERVGGSQTLTADVRLVAATNRNLAAMAEAGSFREDLFYRLEVFPIELPALRDRASDVPLLAQHLLDRIGERQKSSRRQLSDGALELLTSHPWPGNVRQLANVLERAMIVSDGPRLGAAELRPLLSALGGSSDRQRICEALTEADGDKRQAAEILGISYRTLQRRIKEYDLGGFPEYRN